MSVWDRYTDRISSLGSTKHDASLKREVRMLSRKMQENLSYQKVTMFSQDYGYNITSPEMASFATEQEVAILDSDNLNEKYVYSLPGEDIENGALIYWDENYWLVSERDANTTVHTRSIMIQCNHLLKWVSDDNTIIEQWSVVEDGTKYLTGEIEDRDFVVTRGDPRIAITIARNSETVKLSRANRFLIDDPDSPHKLAYVLSKPLKIGRTYNNAGVYKFVLQEVTATVDDNHELGIADYYKYFPVETTGEDNEDASTAPGKKVWL